MVTRIILNDSNDSHIQEIKTRIALVNFFFV